MAYPYIPTGYHGGGQGSVSRIVIHGTVSPTVKGGARAVARYFQSPSTGGSAHYVVDPGEIVQCVKEGTVAYHAPPNTGSIGIELCDPQKGVSSRWGDAGHEAMLRLAARLTREVAARWGVPLRRLSVTDLKAGKRGICGHVDVANAWHQTDHSDPGGSFPWAHFMDLVNGEDDDMPSPEDLWNREWKKSDSPVDGWQMDSIVANSNARLRNIEAKLDAQTVTIDKLADALASAQVMTPEQVEDLKLDIRDAIDSIVVHVDTDPKE